MSRPPRNLAASIHQRLLNGARERREDPHFILQRYAAERFLYRLGISPHREQFVLKGAMLFALWGGSVYRATRDLDFTGYGSDEIGAVLDRIREICSVAAPDDGMTFDATTLRAEPIREEVEYGGVRIVFEARLGSAQVRMQVDVGFGNAIEPRASDADYPTLLDAPAPRIRAYPHEAVVAEKLHAMVVLGERNSRCGVLGELYGGGIESRFARDVPEVVAMVRGETTEPITIQESSFQANRLLTLRTRNSSAYKGLYALLMRDGGRDFRTGEPIEAQTFFDDKVDIHHIFPEMWCKAAGIEPGTYNSVIHKTALAARTNRQIGGRAPSKYLPAIEKAATVGTERMDEILRSHCIAPKELRDDRFWEFFGARAEALLQRIEAATGNSITREPELFRAGVSAEAYDEGPEEWDAEEPLEEAAS